MFLKIDCFLVIVNYKCRGAICFIRFLQHDETVPPAVLMIL